MNKLKKGFTIAELLLVIVIIGIISAMGANITKKSSAKAYNMFWSNGYTTLSDIISEIEYNNSSTSDVNAEQMVYETFTTDDWAKNVNYIINGAKADDPVNNTVTTNNGTTYHFEPSGNAHIITMSVPAPKTRNNNSRAAARIYFDPSGSNFLIPISGGDVDLSTRQDLLPVTIDDGQRDRVLQKYDGSDTASLKRGNTYTFQEAYCRVYGDTTTDVDCTNIQAREAGVLKFVSKGR